MILPGFHAPNLASRVLGLSLRRLSDDMLAAHGYPVLVAETFVDPARFAGTCYRVANWRSLGMTGGYARQPGAAPDWLQHGQPKEILVFELQANAGAALRHPATVELHASASRWRCVRCSRKHIEDARATCPAPSRQAIGAAPSHPQDM